MENPLPRPRDYRSAAFNKLVDQLHEIITGHELPDVPEAPPNAFEPMPPVVPGEIIGLMEYLDARGGTEDIFKIAADTNREFGQVIAVTKAAEMLDFVDTPKRNVVLEPLGKKLVSVSPEERRELFRQALLRLRLFREVRQIIERSERKEVEADVVYEVLAINLPCENYEALFDTMVRWGRFAELLTYDENTGRLGLP